MSTRFEEFLKQKAEESDWRDRNRSRSEWLLTLNHLFAEIRKWLREADPEGLLEVVPYQVERVEQRLGIYDAPALKIRLGTNSIDILPMGRHVTNHLQLQNMLVIPSNVGRWGDLSGGRVDVTDGERRYQLLRSTEAGQDRWYAWSVKPPLLVFDRDRLEEILQDLLR